MLRCCVERAYEEEPKQNTNWWGSKLIWTYGLAGNLVQLMQACNPSGSRSSLWVLHRLGIRLKHRLGSVKKEEQALSLAGAPGVLCARCTRLRESA